MCLHFQAYDEFYYKREQVYIEKLSEYRKVQFICSYSCLRCIVHLRARTLHFFRQDFAIAKQAVVELEDALGSGDSAILSNGVGDSPGGHGPDPNQQAQEAIYQLLLENQACKSLVPLWLFGLEMLLIFPCACSNAPNRGGANCDAQGRQFFFWGDIAHAPTLCLCCHCLWFRSVLGAGLRRAAAHHARLQPRALGLGGRRGRGLHRSGQLTTFILHISEKTAFPSVFAKSSFE